MANQFEDLNLAQLQSAADAIALTLDSKLLSNRSALSEVLEFHYRWRTSLSTIALNAGGLQPSEVPDFPYDAERIQDCLAMLQPKIRRTTQKKWGWFGILVVLPIFGAVQCVQVNQQMLDVQTEQVKLELEQLQVESKALGWEFEVPDVPTWNDVITVQASIDTDKRLAPHVAKVTQVADNLGFAMDFQRPYSDAQFGDYSFWLEMVERDGQSLLPFSMRTVQLSGIALSDSQIQRTISLNHQLSVMSRLVDPKLMAILNAESLPETKDNVMLVSWNDAVMAANQMSLRKGYDPCYTQPSDSWVWENEDCDGFRLPTEIELLQIYRAQSDEGASQSTPEWAWDMYDSSWLWNLPKGSSNPRIDRVNVANPAHVLRLGSNERRSGDGEKGVFRLVRLSEGKPSQ